jgi:hypothetical protein
MLGLGGSETNIKAVITADDKASSVLKGFGDNVSNLGGFIETGLKAAAIGLAAAGAAATAFGVSSIKAFTESQDLIAQTNAVLKSTGGIAGVTAAEVTKLASALEKQTKFSDEDVRSVENLLLTFTSVGKDIFPQATATVLDMAQALGEDTKSAAIQLGKALQDPVLGVTALRRVGVNFNSAQQEVIKNLVDTGKSAEAQQLIMKELTKEFGGSAQAAGGTFAGQLARLKNQFNNVQEAIGEMLVKALNPLTDIMSKIDWQRVTEVSTQKLKEAGRILGDVAEQMKKVYDQVANYLSPKLEALWNSVNEKLIPALSDFWHNILEPMVPVIGTILVGAIGAAVDILKILVDVMAPVFQFMADHKTTVEILAGAFALLATSMALGAAFDAIIVGMATLQLVTFPALIATLGAVTATWVAAFPVAGILADIALVTAAIKSVLGAKKAVDDAYNAAVNAETSYQASHGRLLDLQKNGTPEQQAAATKALKAGFASGGYTGAGAADEVAGIVHKGEYVVPKSQVDQNRGVPMMPGNGGVTNVVVNIGLYTGSEQEKRKVAMEIFKSLQDIAGSKSMTVSQMLGA